MRQLVQDVATKATPLASGGVLALVAILCSWHLLRTFWKLRDIPGPFWAKFTDLYRAGMVKTGRSHEIYQAYHEKYGSLLRLGPNMVSVADPAAIPVIYPMRPGFPKVRLFYWLRLRGTLT